MKSREDALRYVIEIKADETNRDCHTRETVTVDFGSVGSITLDKSMVKDEGFGKFFEVPVDPFGAGM